MVAKPSQVSYTSTGNWFRARIATHQTLCPPRVKLRSRCILRSLTLLLNVVGLLGVDLSLTPTELFPEHPTRQSSNGVLFGPCLGPIISWSDRPCVIRNVVISKLQMQTAIITKYQRRMLSYQWADPVC